MTAETLASSAAAEGLIVMGETPSDHGGLILLGAGPGLWPRFQSSAEWADEAPNPLDRWSRRVIDALAHGVGGTAFYPSDGPPYLPFIQWALDTGRFWQSPTGMMVHDTAGLMISIRGAIDVPGLAATPDTGATSPCTSCVDKPCVSACPVGALSAHAPYDVPSCKSHIATHDGADCLSGGCLARRACPVSQSFGRDPAQSAFHMRAFLGA